MANLLEITDGTNTVVLSATDAYLEGYNPQNFGASANDVTEAHQVEFIGGNSTVDANLVELERLFEQARIWDSSRKGARVYIQISLDGTTVWRSEVYDGRILSTGDMVKYERALGIRQATVVVRRANWWEGAEAQIPLTNGNGTANTSGLAVYNCNDGSGSSPTKKNNYVAITGTDVAGDLPGATRLEITNTYATSRLYYLWIGQNWTDPGNFVHTLEAESATGASATASASASGGYYVRKSITTSETTALTWALDATFLNACKGNYYKALVFMYQGDTRNFKFRLKITWNSTTLWQSGQVQPANLSIAVRDIATFRLPPWLPSLSSLDGVNLVLTAQSTTTTQDLDVDFLMLMPTDGWRQLVYIGYGAAQNKRIMDDGIAGDLYQDAGDGSGKIGNISGYGRPIQLYPGKNQRLYFGLHTYQADLQYIDESISVKLYYRPRRLSL